jgi:hypothetical protein
MKGEFINRVCTPVTFQFRSVSFLIPPILCAMALSIAGCDGGVGEVAAADAVATDATAIATAEIAAEAAVDAVSKTAIAGSMDIPTASPSARSGVHRPAPTAQHILPHP